MDIKDVDDLLDELLETPESSFIGVVKYYTYKESRKKCAEAIAFLLTELENKDRLARMYNVKLGEDLEILARAQAVISQLQSENASLRNRPGIKVGCGTDEAENAFDGDLRIKLARTVMRAGPLTPDKVLDLMRGTYIQGFHKARS